MSESSAARPSASIDPIVPVIDAWHDYLKRRDPAALERLLDDAVVFYSPVVFTPQQGKAITTLYLTAAAGSLGGEEKAPAKTGGGSGGGSAGGSAGGKFRYTKQVLDGHHALLEFETSVDGKYVNGIDLITCNDAGRIVEFKVMIRPLQAVNAVHRQMAAMLEKMKPA